MTPEGALDRGLQELSIELPATARNQLLAYIDLLVKWFCESTGARFFCI